jgi:hypothetical protein
MKPAFDVYINHDGHRYCATFSIDGRYYPATMEDPEQHPEVDIQYVRELGFGNADVWDTLPEDVQDKITQACYNSPAYNENAYQ